MESTTLIDEFLKILNQIKDALFAFLPKLAGAVFIFLIGFLIARLVRFLVRRFINKLHFLIPNQKIRHRVKSFIEEKPVAKVISGILYWLLIIFFLTIATETLGFPIVTTWLSGIVGYLPRILTAVLIGIAGVIGGVILRDIVTTAATAAGVVNANALGIVVQVVVLLVSILIGIEQIGINVTLIESVFVIAIGALLFGAALAFGIGARTSVSNILASFYLQRIYRIGDKIRIGENEGRIIAFTPLAVILDSQDGQTCIPAQEFNKENSILLSRDN